jgi:hypothetical protein
MTAPALSGAQGQDRGEIPWTAEQLTQGVANALKARNFEAVHDFIRLLVVVDPRQAEAVWETLQLGIALGKVTPAPGSAGVPGEER